MSVKRQAEAKASVLRDSKSIEAGVSIGRQHAGERSQVRLRSLAFAIRGIAEQYSRCVSAGGGSIVAHVRP